jgi:hypothetical protein
MAYAADFDLLLDKDRRWSALRQSTADLERCPQNGRPGDRESVQLWFAEKLTDERLSGKS